MEEYLTISEVAVRLRMKPKTIRNKMAAGVFKRGVHYFRRSGMKPVFKWDAVVKWVEQEEATQTEEDTDNSTLWLAVIGCGSQHNVVDKHRRNVYMNYDRIAIQETSRIHRVQSSKISNRTRRDDSQHNTVGNRRNSNPQNGGDRAEAHCVGTETK